MKVCYFGTYRSGYSRNQIMIAGLQANGVEVVECHSRLWSGLEDRVEVATGSWFHWSFLKRIFCVYKDLVYQYCRLAKDYDVMVVGYPGQLDVYLARLLTWLAGKPLVLDMFMSIYLIALERKLEQRSPISIGLLRQLEAIACKLPDRLICDTTAYVAWHVKTHRVSPQKFRLVPTGADDRIFKPLPADRPDQTRLQVLYYGSYIPNHGVETIIEAAHLLRDKAAIHFALVGDGPDKAAAQSRVADDQLTNVTFIDWVEKAVLIKKIAKADVILGAFGTTPQSLMTIQNKIYEGLISGKPVITGDSATIQAVFTHGEHLMLVERLNPQALATAIIELWCDPQLRSALSKAGHEKAKAEFTIAPIGRGLKHHLEEVIDSFAR